MSPGDWLKNKLNLFKDDFDFRVETLILNLTERICQRMKQKNINRTELSNLLYVSPPAVTKILNGNSNFTLKTLLSLADALEQDLVINFIDKEVIYSEAVGVTTKAFNVTRAYSDENLPHAYFTSTSGGSFYDRLSPHREQKEGAWEEAA